MPAKGFLAHREPGDTIRTYVALHRAMDWFEGWAPELVALITDAGTPVLRTMHQLPDAHRWDRVPGVP